MGINWVEDMWRSRLARRVHRRWRWLIGIGALGLLQLAYVIPQSQKTSGPAVEDAFQYWPKNLPPRAPGSLDALSLVTGGGHPLESACKFPVLRPNDANLAGNWGVLRNTTPCNEIGTVAWQDADGFLLIKRESVVLCVYRGIGGTLGPSFNLTFIDSWVNINTSKIWVPFDQYMIICELPDGRRIKEAFAHFTIPKKSPLDKNSEQLSIDMLVLDSVSLNQFKRHMPQSWSRMRNMGFHWLEGYNKVGENTLPNMHALFTGRRFRGIDSAAPVTQPPDVLSTSSLDPDEKPQFEGPYDIEANSDFFWQSDMDGATTLYSHDEFHTLDLYFYPMNFSQGFRRPPSDYYLRPWCIAFFRGKTRVNCNFLSLALRQLENMERFMRLHRKHWHFAYTHIVSQTHETSSRLQEIDTTLCNTLRDLESSGALNRSLFMILGDHGQRIDPIVKTYVGRLEERLSLATFRFPPWFRARHPRLMETLDINRNRFTTAFDLHKMMRDVARGRYEEKESNPELQGLSLFREIPPSRSCLEVDVPRRFCTCLVPSATRVEGALVLEALGILADFLSSHGSCVGESPLSVLDAAFFTVNEQVRAGVHSVHYEICGLGELRKPQLMELEYLELRTRHPQFTLLTRFQIYLRGQHIVPRTLLNVEPLILQTHAAACAAKTMAQFCRQCV